MKFDASRQVKWNKSTHARRAFHKSAGFISLKKEPLAFSKGFFFLERATRLVSVCFANILCPRRQAVGDRQSTGLARDLSRINIPCVLWCVVFRCVAQSAFILLVCHCLSHTTKGSFCNISKTKNGQHLLDYRCCPLKICFDPFSDRMKESNFLILFVGCALLRLFKTLAGRVHIGFNFPKLLRILPDGFELGIGFGMLLFQSGIRNFRNEKSWIPVALWSSY